MDRFPSADDCIGGVRVGLWLSLLAAEYRCGALPLDRFELAMTAFRKAVLGDQLEKDSRLIQAWAGERATYEAQWEGKVRAIKCFIDKYDRVPQHGKAAERQLATWLAHRRSELNAGDLSAERCASAYCGVTCR